ncbi:terminase TerL endonuclease subunit [Oceanobacillus indicireducens]|uniref:Terminase n=1 Tax=Oceanobacillus indicireducens TaxID=1004261 RepID=A0A917Y474_9BACI|nr:terminase TerL endonuclease subunit [Oceanobacillus indicireducens]GGN66799.1 terminase [Oceanobacillus indicireducens]
MIKQKYVEAYINEYRTGKIKLNKERIWLIEYLEEHVLNRDDIYFDEKQIEQCIKYCEKWFFPFQSFQKFITAFLFLKYKETDRLFYRRFLIMMGRGGGKNGYISAISSYLKSELHGVKNYNISLVANSEDQAKTSFEEVYNVIDENDTLKKSFQHGKQRITNRKTKSFLRFRTSNPQSKDGGREGMVVFDEIHMYETAKTVRVMRGGLGKVPFPREMYIGTDGYVREGFIDSMKKQAARILKGQVPNANMFPFICKLDVPDEVDDMDMWEKANPMLTIPLTDYAENLLETIKEEYFDLEEDPSGREEFMTKRMNLPEEDVEKSVAPWDEIWATGFETDYEEPNQIPRVIPNLKNRVCVGGLDYARIKDFASVGLLFKIDNNYVWKTHSFVRREFLKQVKIQAPIEEWEEQGLLTIVDGPVIDIKHIVNWFVDMRLEYGVNTIVADTFRLDLVKTALEDEGFELVYIRNPKAIHSLLAPRIETLFAQRELIFGDNPLMRWATNNVLVVTKKDGNKEYLKKDELTRKTDPFQAFIHAMFKADDILVDEGEFLLADIKF